MKIGPRKPSIKKSISARTTGKAKRSIKKTVIPGYGKKGTGLVKNPEKTVYNKIYSKTTFNSNLLSSINKGKKNNINTNTEAHESNHAYILEVVGTLYTDSKRIIRNVLKDRGDSWNTNGYQYHNLKLMLIPEPDNEYDSQAIAVYSNHPTPKNAKINRSGKIGYLPKNSGLSLDEPTEVDTIIKEGFGKFYITIDATELLEKKENVSEIENTNDSNIENLLPTDTDKVLVNKFKFSLLAIFFGMFGIHWFYVQNFKRGLLYFLFSWTFIPYLLSLYEGMRALLTPTDGNHLIEI